MRSRWAFRCRRNRSRTIALQGPRIDYQHQHQHGVDQRHRPSTSQQVQHAEQQQHGGSQAAEVAADDAPVIRQRVVVGVQRITRFGK